jgi:hypothetical protein
LRPAAASVGLFELRQERFLLSIVQFTKLRTLVNHPCLRTFPARSARDPRTIGVHNEAEDGERMSMSDEPDAYQTYVLRLWRARCQGKWQWRASLESPNTGERHTFASLPQLFAYWW